MAEDKQSVTNFTYFDPSRSFSGDPFEAAGKAAQQAEDVLRLTERAVSDTNIQARNAWMQRNLEAGDNPRAEDWENSPEAKRIASVVEQLASVGKTLRGIGAAARYNPKAPPKE